MRQFANGNQIDTGLRNGSRRLERQTAAGLEAHLGIEFVSQGDCLTHLIEIKVVDEHFIGAGHNGLTKPGKRVDFDLDRNGRLEFPNALVSNRDSAGSGHMIVFDERHVRQAHSMILAPTTTNGVLL